MMLNRAEMGMVSFSIVGLASGKTALIVLKTGTMPAFIRMLSNEMERMAVLVLFRMADLP